MAEVESGWKGMDRRTFLKGAAGGVGSLFVPPAFPEIAYGANCRLPERVDGFKESDEPIKLLKQRIQDKFQVNAIETSHAYAQWGIEEPSKIEVPFFGSLPTTWSEPSLKMLYNILDTLPPHFIAPHNDQHLQIAMENLTYSECMCGGYFIPDDYEADPPEILPDIILVDAMALLASRDSGQNEVSVRRFFHETDHRFDIDISRMAAWDDLSSAFGGQEFTTLAGDIRSRIAEVGNVGLQPAEEMAAGRLSYAFSEERTDFREVTASLAEIYIYGENYFNKGMSLYVGREAVSEIYDVMRDAIFRGIEYESIPQICT